MMKIYKKETIDSILTNHKEAWIKVNKLQEVLKDYPSREALALFIATKEEKEKLTCIDKEGLTDSEIR